MKKINCKSLSLHLSALTFIVIFNFCVMPQLNYAIAVENASQPAGIALGAKVETPRLGMPVPYEGRKIKTVLCYGDSNTYGADPMTPMGVIHGLFAIPDGSRRCLDLATMSSKRA